MNHRVPEDIRWLIEAKVRLSSESSNSFISYMPGTGKSTFAKKCRAKRLKVCHRYAKWTCNTTCRSLKMVSIKREDKKKFIKDGLSKRSLNNLLLTLETLIQSGKGQIRILTLNVQLSSFAAIVIILNPTIGSG